MAAIVPFVAFLSAVLVWYLGQRAARRDCRASAFAAALAAVEKYAEFPYRIRRRAGTDDARYLLSDAISETQAEIAFHQLWLDLEAPTAGASYRDLGRPARRQAGQQMNSAWLEPVIANDANMNPRGSPTSEIGSMTLGTTAHCRWPERSDCSATGDRRDSRSWVPRLYSASTLNCERPY